ncbi:MAG TPA: hypothetical protein PK014_02200 [Thermoanaerobaculia bacterium]|nr:hypothetical protein [Thermoanaerobaculia bacterium]HUM28955.1 hypothetical protein [Thermoanaerobaculia bacterium]HXK67113.1 hypothetical protein [Thermoanaerobaculia bacterium]
MAESGILSNIDRQMFLSMIESAISPYIGANMARASLKMHCDRLNLFNPVFTAEECEILLEKLAKGLHVFIGEHSTLAIIQEIHQKMEEKGIHVA